MNKEFTIDSEVILSLKEAVGMDHVREQEPMNIHSSMKTGGPAALFITPEDAAGCAAAVRILNEQDIPWYVIGNATNILFKDSGYNGAIIQLLDNFNDVRVGGQYVTAQAGCRLKSLADIICLEGLAGFEFASGIPGSLGGAVTMNAGAYGGEMKDVISSVTAMDRHGKLHVFEGSEADFSYRHSIFSSGDYIVLEAKLKLEPGDPLKIRELMDDLNQRRADKQPLDYPSCGSVFKRPEGYFAGKLIMDSDLAGARRGGASVSSKHCGFIINDREATTEDVLGLIAMVQETVKDKFGVELECEVKVL